jgi:hypothetical protein
LLFYAGLGLHFGPSFLAFDDNYGAASDRMQNWSRAAFELLPALSPAALHALAALTGVAWACGLLGLAPRLSAAGTGFGLYAFASFNSRSTQTLALGSTWAVLWIWAVAGGGNHAFALRRARHAPAATRAVAGDALPRYLVAAHMMMALFFAGLEKMAADWPFSNEMAALFKSPAHFMMRAPFSGLADPLASTAGMIASVATVAIELSIPVLALSPRTRPLAGLATAAFFTTVIATMQVPPLFFCIYFGAAVLLIDDRLLGRLDDVAQRGGPALDVPRRASVD